MLRLSWVRLPRGRLAKSPVVSGLDFRQMGAFLVRVGFGKPYAVTKD
jgi:hypothetical protein